MARTALKDLERAAAAFERAIAAEPGMEQAYVLLSRAYRATGRPEEARRVLETLRGRQRGESESKAPSDSEEKR